MVKLALPAEAGQSVAESTRGDAPAVTEQGTFILIQQGPTGFAAVSTRVRGRRSDVPVRKRRYVPQVSLFVSLAQQMMPAAPLLCAKRVNLSIAALDAATKSRAQIRAQVLPRLLAYGRELGVSQVAGTTMAVNSA